MGVKILVVGDPHCSPYFDNRRFDWLGTAILELEPDIVYCTGDVADFHSLSSYDKGRKSGELRRYKADVESVIDALKRINKPLDDYNFQRKNIRKAKRKLPRKIITLGNHSYRLNRAVDLSPELEGTLSIADLRLTEFGWEVYPFRQAIEIEGIWCSHFFSSGVSGLPISGFNLAATLLTKNSVSSLVGHSHLLDWAVRSKPNGDKLMALSAGCFLEEPTFHDATIEMWWKGLCVLHNTKNGCYDLETIEMKRVEQLYG